MFRNSWDFQYTIHSERWLQHGSLEGIKKIPDEKYPCSNAFKTFRIFGKEDEAEKGLLTEFGEDRVFNDLRYTINNDKLQELGWKEVRRKPKQNESCYIYTK